MQKPPSPPEMGLLSDEEFERLPIVERLEYLKRAIKVRDAINKQIEATLNESQKLHIKAKG